MVEMFFVCCHRIYYFYLWPGYKFSFEEKHKMNVQIFFFLQTKTAA